MTHRGSDILVGLFVIIFGGLLIAAVLWLSSSRAGKNYDEYIVYMQESVAGLSRDSSVKFYGVDVGRVHKISLGGNYPRQVKLLLQLNQGTPVTQDTVATLEAQGLTGLSYINLHGGQAESPPLTRTGNEDHPVIQSKPSIWGHLDKSLAELSENLIRSSEKLEKLLSDENQALVSRNLSQLLTLTSQLTEHSDTLTQSIEDLGATLHNTRLASASLPTLSEKLMTTAESLNHMTQEISKTAVSVRKTVHSGGKDIKELARQTLPGLQSLLTELQRTAENFRLFSEKLERNPQILLYGQSPTPRGPGE